MKLFRKRKASDLYVWRLHGPDTKPDPDTVAARVVSIRAVDGYLATSPPKIGNRLLVHALVKFNTNQVIEGQYWFFISFVDFFFQQSLQVYNKAGELLSSTQPKKVVEYLVLEKRMWYDGPWTIRDQIFAKE